MQEKLAAITCVNELHTSDLQASTQHDQNVAIGFNGDPVPPFTGIGAALTRNAQRFRFAAASPSASRSHLSKIGDVDAATVAFEVGYESASQFNREYSRLFGQPPLRDIKALLSPGAPKIQLGGTH
jgi:AraC-like DNA-binding protein